jgi:hypothetical protein
VTRADPGIASVSVVGYAHVRARLAGRLLPVLPWITLLFVWFAWVDDIRRSDFQVFLRAADDVRLGVNPYTHHTDPFLWGGSAYVYPFLTAFLFVPFALLPVGVADVLWFGLSGAAIVAGCRALGLRDPWSATAILLCATTVRSFQVGALNPFLFLAVALMWRHRERTRVVASCFTFLVVAKLFLLPMALWLVATRPRRVWLTALGTAAGVLLVSQLVAPISVGEYVAEMRVLADHEGIQGMSLLRLVHDLWPGLLESVLPVALGALVGLGSAKVAVASGLRLGGRGLRVESDRLLFCATLVIALAVTPVFWSHYVVLALVVPLVLRPARTTAIAMGLLSWVVSRPADTTMDHYMTTDKRITLLFGSLLLGLALAAWDLRRAAERRAPLPGRVRDASVVP